MTPAVDSTGCNSFLAHQAPLATTALTPPLTFHHNKPTSSPEPPFNVPQLHHYPSTHHRSSTDSAAEIGLVPETAFPSPHPHSRTTQPLDTRPSQTDLLRLPATADTCIKHFGRLPTPAPPLPQLTTYLLTHRPPPPEAPGHRFVSHSTLRSKKPVLLVFSHSLHRTTQQSHIYLRSHLNSRRAASCLPLRLLTTPWSTTLLTGTALPQSPSK